VNLGSILANYDGFGLLILLLVALMILQRRLHFEIQAIFLLLTRRPDLSLALFSLLFFPGVLIHEVSHFLMARALGVRTGKFSLLPRPLPDGKLQLGFVETASTDVIRDSLIGVAPLLIGGIFVGYTGLVQLGLSQVWYSMSSTGLDSWIYYLTNLNNQPDFWLWFYLAFAVSSTMLPSASDRKAWLPIALIGVVLVCLALVLGAGPWLLNQFAPQLNHVLRIISVVFGVSAAIHVFLLVPLLALRLALSRTLRMRVS
jgi:hypothetical protein